MSLGIYDDYPRAQYVVDYLSDHEFPVQNVVIVGTELKSVERVTGRLTHGKVAAAGAGAAARIPVHLVASRPVRGSAG
ncbi:hypothetical protein BBK14_30585 [Parafrankia soli]|uniref:General stress protein 17M-like domain-containing protein n=1 Tax=Parafrankia soli TaxID=2599596 RepID=A0A1S1RHL3_9ACTN|nr:general stress protein [Parafrankia soli]OHV44875.1 hypothetical protein BBK14_30585 [Parafrankia soli]